LRLVTWNVNSVRLRLEQLELVDHALRPDILCLQETKVVDPLFPREAFTALGFRHQALLGQKGYNGVAILSRLPLDHVESRNWCDREDCRHLIATIDGLEVHCLYVPAGGDIPDPEQNDKFAHKLRFLDEVTGWFRETSAERKSRVLLGDFNIAPLASDVWSHRPMLKVVSHSPIEIDKMAALQASANWTDAIRHFIPPTERLSTWWSYRAKDWLASDRGRRLDHIWVSPDLTERLVEGRIFIEPRGWQPSSDHVPVLVDLE
jgi:exodeoxyribonuclease-3